MIRIYYASILLVTIICLENLGMEKRVRIQESKSVRGIDQFYLARQKNVDMIKLIANSIKLNAQEPVTGLTMLHYAVLLADYNTIRFLLSTQEINPYIRNASGRTASEIAGESGLKILQQLLEDYSCTTNI